MKIKLLAIILLLSSNCLLNAQNKLWLTNGKQKEISEYKLDQKDLVIYKNKKGKLKSIERFDVFSIIENNGKEIVVYEKDSSDSEIFNLLEMKAFVQGQYDAYQKFKSPLATLGGAGVAIAASATINPPIVILISGAYCGVIGATKPNEKKIIIPQEYANNDHYLLGYKKAAKQKKIKNAIVGSLIGLAAGFTAFYIIK